jgi:hypothetical protein
MFVHFRSQMRYLSPYKRRGFLMVGIAWGLHLWLGAASVCATEASDNTTPQETNGARDRARELFREASEQAMLEDWVGAAQLYKRSYAEEPHASALLNVGLCFERLGQPAFALSYVLQALAESGESELQEADRVAAQRHQERLASQLGTVVLTAAGTTEPTGLRVSVSGYRLRAFPGQSSGVAMLVPSEDGELETFWVGGATVKLPPGNHEIALARDNERQVFHLRVTHAHREIIIWSKPVVLPTPVDVNPSPSLPPLSLPLKSPPPVEETWNATRVGAVSALAVAALGTGVALGYGIGARRLERRLDEVCDDGGCPLEHRNSVERYKTMSTLSNVGVGVGLGGIGAGLILYGVDWLLTAAPSGLQANIRGVHATFVF